MKNLSWLMNKISAHIHQPQIDESTIAAMQHHMAQQAAFSQIPDDVKGVRTARHIFRIVGGPKTDFVTPTTCPVHRTFSSSCP